MSYNSSNANDSTTTEVLSGGAVRVSFGVPAPETTYAIPPSQRVGNEALRFHEDGSVESVGGVTRHVVTFDGVPGGGIMATRERINGADTVELIPGQPSSRTNIRQAIRDGLVKETSPGIYEDVKQANGAQRTLADVQAEQQQAIEAQLAAQDRQQAIDNQGIFSAEEDAAFAAEFADVPETAFRPALASTVRAIALGEGLASAAATLSRETGMDPSEALQKVTNGVALQQRVVDRALAKVGLQGEQLEAFYTDLMKDPGKVQNGLHFLLHARDVSVFQQLGREWLARTERVAQVENDRREAEMAGRPASDAEIAPGLSEETLRAAGFRTSVTRQGVLMVQHGNGRWMPASQLLEV